MKGLTPEKQKKMSLKEPRLKERRIVEGAVCEQQRWWKMKAEEADLLELLTTEVRSDDELKPTLATKKSLEDRAP